METITKTRKIGGSLVITLPNEIVKAESIMEGELVKIKVEKIRRSGFGILRGIGKFKREDELDTELK